MGARIRNRRSVPTVANDLPLYSVGFFPRRRFLDTEGTPSWPITLCGPCLRDSSGGSTISGVDRPKLYQNGNNRLRIRAHDQRATFVTLSLANGKSERLGNAENGAQLVHHACPLPT